MTVLLRAPRMNLPEVRRGVRAGYMYGSGLRDTSIMDQKRASPSILGKGGRSVDEEIDGFRAEEAED